MDLATQTRILEIAQGGSGSTPLVLLGAPDAESAELAALTVTSGDPTFAGPLAGVQLGLPVYHILEEAIESVADDSTFDEHIGVMKLVLDADGISAAVKKVRRARNG